MQHPDQVRAVCPLSDHSLFIAAHRRVIYHGPVTEVQQHFQSIGFDLPPRMDVPSWLVEITTPSGAQHLHSTLLSCLSCLGTCTTAYHFVDVMCACSHACFAGQAGGHHSSVVCVQVNGAMPAAS